MLLLPDSHKGQAAKEGGNESAGYGKMQIDRVSSIIQIGDRNPVKRKHWVDSVVRGKRHASVTLPPQGTEMGR